MLVPSARFTVLEVDAAAVLTFPDGLIGLLGTTYTLVAHEEGSPFHWPPLAGGPRRRRPGHQPLDLLRRLRGAPDRRRGRPHGLSSAGDAEVMCVVRAAPDLADFTINLAGPIVVHSARRVGRQIVNDAGCSVRTPLFSEVEMSAAEPAVPVTAVAT